jgi:hypothetical protein
MRLLPQGRSRHAGAALMDYDSGNRNNKYWNRFTNKADLEQVLALLEKSLTKYKK